MAKAKQVVKSFMDMMLEVDILGWQPFLEKEETRLKRRFYSMGKNLGEESRLIAYLNFLAKNPNMKPTRCNNSYAFFDVWKRVSGYMPFEGRAGDNPGKSADMARVCEGISMFLQDQGVRFDPNMTQEDWDADFLYHYQKVFGEWETPEPTDSDIPF